MLRQVDGSMRRGCVITDVGGGCIVARRLCATPVTRSVTLHLPWLWLSRSGHCLGRYMYI